MRPERRAGLDAALGGPRCPRFSRSDPRALASFTWSSSRRGVRAVGVHGVTRPSFLCIYQVTLRFLCCSNRYRSGNLVGLVLVHAFLLHLPITRRLSARCACHQGASKLQGCVVSGPPHGPSPCVSAPKPTSYSRIFFFSLSHCSFSTFGFIWPLPGMGLGCNAAFSIQEIHRDLYCVGVSAHVRLKSFFLDYQLDERPGCIPRKLSLVGVTFPNSP